MQGTFLTTEQLAERWHVSPGTLRNRRYRGDDFPAATQIGRRLLYALADVERFEASRREVAAR
jgi:hypothetical protein